MLMAKTMNMSVKKPLILHVLIRTVGFFVLAGLIYLLLNTVETFGASGWDDSFFAAASILALILMAEMILFFTKKKMERLYCNVGLLFVLFLFVVIAIPMIG